MKNSRQTDTFLSEQSRSRLTSLPPVEPKTQQLNLFNFRQNKCCYGQIFALTSTAEEQCARAESACCSSVLASSAVLLIWKSWPRSCSCSSSCSWHCVEKTQTATERRQGCAQSRFVCLFVCFCLYERCAAVIPRSHVRWFSFPLYCVIAADLMLFVYSLFSILTRKTKCVTLKLCLFCVTASIR